MKKTIFDFNPTEKELSDIGFGGFTTYLSTGISEGLTKEQYIEKIPEDRALFDIAILHEIRGEKDKANEFWAQIPQLYKEYLLGFDNEQKEV